MAYTTARDKPRMRRTLSPPAPRPSVASSTPPTNPKTTPRTTADKNARRNSSPQKRPNVPRIARALRHAPVLWADRVSDPYLFALAPLLPLHLAFLARIAPYDPTAPRPSLVAYSALIQLRAGLLVVRDVDASNGHAVGILSLQACSLNPVPPNAIAIISPASSASQRALLIAPCAPHLFRSIATTLKAAAARPAPPPASRFSLVARLSSSASSSVFVVRHQLSGLLYAVKAFRRSALSDLQLRASVLHYRATLQQTTSSGSPFLLPLSFAITNANALLFFSPFYPLRDLYRVLRLRRAALSEADGQSLIAQIIVACRNANRLDLHPLSLVRPDNVFIDSRGWIRLSTFGLPPVHDHTLLPHAIAFRRRTREITKPRKNGAKANGESRPSARIPASAHLATDALDERVEDTGMRRYVRGAVAGFEDSSALLQATALPEQLTDVEEGDETDGTATGGEGGTNSGESRKERAVGAWSLGILAHFAMTGQLPLMPQRFCDDDDDDSSDSASNSPSSSSMLAAAKLSDERDGLPMAGAVVSERVENAVVRDFIEKLLRRHMKNRMGAGRRGLDEICDHEWMGGVKWAGIERGDPAHALQVQSAVDESFSSLEDAELWSGREADVVKLEEDRAAFGLGEVCARVASNPGRRRRMSSMFRRSLSAKCGDDSSGGDGSGGKDGGSAGGDGGGGNADKRWFALGFETAEHGDSAAEAAAAKVAAATPRGRKLPRGKSRTRGLRERDRVSSMGAS